MGCAQTKVQAARTCIPDDSALLAEIGCSFEELCAVRAIFDSADTSRSGWLSKSELADAARRSLSAAQQKEGAAVDPDGSELAALFDEIDAKRDGRVDFVEFARWWGRGEGDVDTQFMRWFFKDLVRRSFKISKSVKVDKATLADELEVEIRRSFKLQKKASRATSTTS